MVINLGIYAPFYLKKINYTFFITYSYNNNIIHNIYSPVHFLY